MTLIDDFRVASNDLYIGNTYGRAHALCNGAQHSSYEAQAAIILETCCSATDEVQGYPFAFGEGDPIEIGPAPLFTTWTTDLMR